MTIVSFEIMAGIAESLVTGKSHAEITSQLLQMGIAPDVITREITLAAAHPYVRGATMAYQQAKPVVSAKVEATKHTMNAEWREWTRYNLSRNCKPEEIRDILIKNNFSETVIREVMGERFPLDPAKPLYTIPGVVDYVRLCERPLLSKGHAEGGDKLQLIYLEEFLTVEECDAVSALIRTNQRRSTVTGNNEYSVTRTSHTCDLGLFKEQAVLQVEEKISRILGINLSYSEVMQGQHYKVGEEFREHTDYFEPKTDEYKKHATSKGNRTWTFMVYLNNTPKGGGTHFPSINKTFYPKKGAAVAWNNLYADGRPNPDTKHAGMPVEEGEKLVITKWFRERGSGAMFPDDEKETLCNLSDTQKKAKISSRPHKAKR
jgi:prolyl 4-hydroxylase